MDRAGVRAELLDASLYTRDEHVGHEDTGAPLRVRWMPLSHFTSGAAPLYPDGLLSLLRSIRPGP
jgi:hypothetical protein